jgi:transposase
MPSRRCYAHRPAATEERVLCINRRNASIVTSRSDSGVSFSIEAIGASLRLLPPYSPDFNPIEQAFAKLKAFLRAERPRTYDHVTVLVAAPL